MAEEEAKKVEVEAAKEPEPAAVAAPEPAPKEPEPEAPKEDVAEEKAVIPSPEPPAAEDKAPDDDSKALAIVESEYYYDLLGLFFSLLHRPPYRKGDDVYVYWESAPKFPLCDCFVYVLSGTRTVAVQGACGLWSVVDIFFGCLVKFVLQFRLYFAANHNPS
jgi:hypothetical protein